MALAFLTVAASGGLFGDLSGLYAFTGFCSGPDSVAGLLWAPAIFELAREDQICGVSPSGRSSGADGQKCMNGFNETLFLEGGGTACLVAGANSMVDRYPPNPDLPGCTAAYDVYRDVTSPSFTCDCEGDHASFGGLRSGTVFTLSNVIATMIIAIVGPALGTWIDHNGGKGTWISLLATAGTCMMGQAVLAPGFVWLGGLIIQIGTVVASELVTIPRQTYLLDLSSPTPETLDNHAYQTQVSAKRMQFSYTSQIIFVIIAFILTMFLNTTNSSIAITIIAGLWYLGFFTLIVPKFPMRPATRARSGRNLCAVAFGQLWADLLEMKHKYPEALKYLLFLFIVQNGLATTALSLANSYLLEQLKFSGLQIQIMFIIVLTVGPLWLYLLMKISASRFFSYKKLLLIIILIWIVALILIGVVVNSMGEVGGAWTGGYILFLVVAALLIAPGLTWYYAIYWPAFMSLVPVPQANQFGGIFTMVRTLGLIPQPLIYVAVASGMSSASTGRTIGLLLMLAWDVLAIPLLLWVDFDKGKRDAAAGGVTGKVVGIEVTPGGAATTNQT